MRVNCAFSVVFIYLPAINDALPPLLPSSHARTMITDTQTEGEPIPGPSLPAAVLTKLLLCL